MAEPTVAWVDEATVFSAESRATLGDLVLHVNTVITSGDELEVGWFVERGDEELDCGYLIPSQVGGLRAAFANAKLAAVRRASEFTS